MTRTTPLTTAVPEPAADARPDGARFEAPLYTVPYPLATVRGAFVDTRDLLLDEDALLL